MSVLLEVVGWILITALPTYGALLGLRQIPEIAKYCQAHPDSLITKSLDLLVKPWKVEPLAAGPYLTDSQSAKANVERDGPLRESSSNVVKISTAWVMEVYPGRIRIPGGFWFCGALSISGFFLFIAAVEKFSAGKLGAALAMSGGSISILGLGFLFFVLIWGQVFRKTRLLIHDSVVRVADVQGERAFTLTGPLRFKTELKREWPFGTVAYVWYENIRGPRNLSTTLRHRRSRFTEQCLRLSLSRVG